MTPHRYSFIRLSLALIIVFGVLAAPLHAEPLATARLRIGVTSDGLVVITPQDLVAAGLDPASVNPQTFAMSSQGRSVAVRVTGEQDGHFDPGDRLTFFGQRFRGPEMQQKYTDERVYWLDIGGAAGPRVADVPAAPQNNLQPPTDFPEALRAEESIIWWTLFTLDLDTEDTWFWARLQPVGPAPATTNLAVTVPDPAPGIPATLRVEEIARAYSNSFTPDHHTTISVNNLAVLNETWDGKVRRVFQAIVPASLLASGNNTVAVSALANPMLVVDDVYVNYVELDYRRLFRSWNSQLDFPAEATGPHEYLTTGWTSGQVEIWDVTNPDAPRRMTGASATPAGGETHVRFRTDDAPGARYWLQTANTLSAPASVRLYAPMTDLRQPSGGADVVIVTDEILLPAAQSLAAWHSAHGRRPLVALFRDVVDAFNDGIYHPKAVTAMLTWAQTHWQGPPPAYLTLLGDGHWNFKGFNPAVYPPSPNLVPPYLAWADPYQGEVPADAFYGDLDGDATPDLAIGRIPANNLNQAQVMVDKIISYDETQRAADWQKRALFVADNPDSSGDFQGLTDVIINQYTPFDMIAQRVYLMTPSAPDEFVARAAISSAINNGVLMVQYMGHGSLENWAGESMWRTIDADNLQNGSRLPVVMTFNCLDGYFAAPGRTSMAEAMLGRAGGGSVAAFSPTGLGTVPYEHISASFCC